MKIFYLIGTLLLSFQLFAQEATFYGYVSPTIAHLVPAPSEAANSKDIVIPNFKGRELPVQFGSNEHQPDWVWQQHQNTQKTQKVTKTVTEVTKIPGFIAIIVTNHMSHEMAFGSTKKSA